MMRGNNLGPAGPVLLIFGVAALVVTLGVGVFAYQLVATDDPAVSEPSLSAGVEQPRTDDSSPAEAGAPWRVAARRFGVAFTTTSGGHEAWMKRLRPLVSPSLAQGYSYTDMDLVPTARLERVSGGAAVAGETPARSAQLHYAGGLVVDVTVALNEETNTWVVTTAVPHESDNVPAQPVTDREEVNV